MMANRPCNTCGGSSPPLSKYCPECGRLIPRARILKCPGCKKQIHEFSRFCPKCGKKLSVFNCPVCGRLIDKDSFSCPTCGKNTGLKLLSFLILPMILVPIGSCVVVAKQFPTFRGEPDYETGKVVGMVLLLVFGVLWNVLNNNRFKRLQAEGKKFMQSQKPR